MKYYREYMLGAQTDIMKNIFIFLSLFFRKIVAIPKYSLFSVI
jgi:hypothetical protein